MEAALLELERVINARIAEWDKRQHGPHDKGVCADEAAYRAHMSGRLREAQAIGDALHEIRIGREINWAVPTPHPV